MIIDIKNNSGIDKIRDFTLSKELERFIEDTGMTKTKIAELLELSSYKKVNEFLDGKGDISLKDAMGISELLQVPIENIFNSSKKKILENSPSYIDDIRYSTFLYRNFDVSLLIKLGLFKKEDSDKEKAQQIIEYFGFTSIYDYLNLNFSRTALYSRKSIKTAQEKRIYKMSNFWITTAIQSFIQMNNPNEYNRELLLEFTTKRIKSYTCDDSYGLQTVIFVLYKLGVSVLVQDYLTHTNAYGVSMIVNNKPCIILTGLSGHYFKLWCTLLHELYHILHDWDILQNFHYLISDTEESNLFVSESDANQFAYNCLIPIEFHKDLRLIVKSRVTVNKIAKKLNIHPTIIYGLYAELLTDSDEKSKAFSNLVYTKDILLTKETKCLKNINCNPIKEKSIQKAICKIKKSYEFLTA